MKVTKYDVATIYNDREVDKHWYPTKQAAAKVTCIGNGTYRRKFIGTKEFDLYCSCCDKDLKLGDNYIKLDEDTRYCEDCYEENSITYYTVGGEPVGDENDIEEFDEFDLEVEQEGDNDTEV